MGDARTWLTCEQFEKLPDEPGKCELLAGELIQLPPARRRHSLISERLFLWLHSALTRMHACGQAARLGAPHIEMGYRLGPLTWLQPDVSITHASQPEGDYFEG